MTIERFGLCMLLIAATCQAASGAKPATSKPHPGSKQASQSAVRPTLSQIEASRDRLTPLYTRLPKPEPGDWLAEHEEPGQSFDRYRRSHLDRQPRGKRKIYVQPLGEFAPSAEPLIAATSELLTSFYDARVERLPAIAESEIPPAARRANPFTHKPQILTTYVLDKILIPRRPKDATAVLALTASDLWPGEGWNFVFGQASLSARVGIRSIARYGDPDGGPDAYSACLRRTLKVAMHETGHMFGFEHCTAFACGMNGSNNREEMDRAPLAFCPECQAQDLVDMPMRSRVERLRSLEEFAAPQQLADEGAFWKLTRETLEK